MTIRKKQNGGATASDASRKQTDSDNLTVEDVLKILEENGIRDLQQFVKSQLAQAKASRKARGRASMLGPAPSKPSGRGKAQRPVTVPVLIDGVLYEPKDVHRFDGQVLHFVGPTSTHPTLRAFTGDQWPAILRTYVQVSNAGSLLQWENIPYAPGQAIAAPQAPGVVVEPPPRPAEFFSDSNFGGDYLWLSRGQEWSDLTRVYRGDFYNRQSWNDCISSVSPLVGFGLVVLCEDINLGGASFSVPEAVRDLGVFGFNDRTSSIVYW